jgi:flagellar basal-body rod modification protein FlgD
MNISGTSSTTASGAAVAQLSATTEPTSEDRFLKMLVAQMQNQDPLNPLDNAEVTSQMAQINTVTSLEKLNTSMAGLGTQFVQLQAMQGAALVGHDVAVEGDTLRIRDGVGDAGFELANAADKVKIDIKTAGGTVIDTIELTSQEAGRHAFTWDVPPEYADSELKFEVKATSGATEVGSMPLRLDTISAVSSFGNTLALELEGGDRISYDAVWAFL